MITILLDSSNRHLSVGIAKGEKLIDQTSYEAWQRQSEMMIPELDKLLKKHHFTKDDIGDVIVAIGPGSYTGVRIALTIAKVIVLALNVPLYGVSSLHVMKLQNKPTIALINARSNRSYIGVFENEKVILKDQIMKNEDVLEYIKKHPEYEISGETEYLEIPAKKVNVLEEMLFLKSFLKPCENSLAIKPVYLKD